MRMRIQASAGSVSIISVARDALTAEILRSCRSWERRPIRPAPVDTAFLAAFSHDNETAKPGYYAVTLGNGIKVELTATERSGFGRFTYPAGNTATMVINAASAVNGVRQSAIQIHPAQHEITGWAVGGHFCGGPDEGTVLFLRNLQPALCQLWHLERCHLE